MEDNQTPYLHRETDLQTICEQQREEIAELQRKLQERERELQELNSILGKYSSIIPELKALSRVLSGQAGESAEGSKESAVDFWDTHLDKGGARNVNFEDIASKGLWIMSSSAQPSNLPKTIDQRRALVPRSKPLEDRKRTESMPTNPSIDPDQTPGRRVLKLRQLMKPAGPLKQAPAETSRSKAEQSNRSIREPKEPKSFHRKAPSMVEKLRH